MIRIRHGKISIKTNGILNKSPQKLLIVIQHTNFVTIRIFLPKNEQQIFVQKGPNLMTTQKLPLHFACPRFKLVLRNLGKIK